jgi:hypothetical protein
MHPHAVKRPQCFVGIDPGVTGAICAIIEGAPMPAIFDMPVQQVTTGTKRKPTVRNVLDMARFRGIMAKLKAEYDIYAIVETTAMRSAVRPAEPLINGKPHFCSVCHQPHMIVNQGVASQGSFMRAGGLIVGIIFGLGIGYEEVAANVWTAEVFHGRSEKLDHRQLAAALYPAAACKLARVKDDGRADALLLADYAKRRHGAPF